MLLTRSMIRTPIIVHAEDTKRVVPFSETIEFGFKRERKRGRGEDGEISGDFWRAFIP